MIVCSENRKFFELFHAFCKFLNLKYFRCVNLNFPFSFAWNCHHLCDHFAHIFSDQRAQERSWKMHDGLCVLAGSCLCLEHQRLLNSSLFLEFLSDFDIFVDSCELRRRFVDSQVNFSSF